MDFVPHVPDPEPLRGRRPRGARRDAADDRRRPRLLPRLGRQRGRALPRERRQRRHERRGRAARERDVEGCSAARRRSSTRSCASSSSGRTPWSPSSSTDGERREAPMHDVIVANGQYHGGAMWLAPEAQPGRRPLRRRPDRRHHEARLRHDRAEDLPRHVPRAPEGRAAALADGRRSTRPSGCRSSSTASRSGRRRPASRSCRPRCASACPLHRRAPAAAALAAAYAALAGLVAAGTLTGLDQWAVDHLMPGAPGVELATRRSLDAVVPLLHAHWSRPLDAVASLVTLPGQVVVSRAPRRRRRAPAPAPGPPRGGARLARDLVRRDGDRGALQGDARAAGAVPPRPPPRRLRRVVAERSHPPDR